MWIAYATDLRRRHARRTALIPLAFGGHTLDLYRRLPGGWQTTPDGVYTDRYFWKRLLAVPGCRAISTFAWTAVSLPSPQRRAMSNAERVAEIEGWAARLRDPVERSNLLAALLSNEAEARALVEGSAAYSLGAAFVRALRPLGRIAGRRYRFDRS
jgi:hypothetical protein